MVAESDLPTPLSPYERDQARLIREADELQKKIEALAAQILAKEGPEFKRQAEVDHGVTDPQKLELIAQTAAQLKATKDTIPLRVQPADHRNVVGDAIKQVDADELKRQQQPEPEKEKSAQPQPTPEATDSQQRETEEARKQQLLTNAKELGAKDDVAAAAWVAQAESLDRQRHQHGRYDFNDPPGPSGPSGLRPPVPPQPQPPTPPTPTPAKGALSANEVLQRFGNPELEARYQQQEQRREDAAKASLLSPDSATRAAARGNAPAGKTGDTDLMAAFSPAAIRRKAEEAEAARRANDPTYIQGQGQGRGGRGR